MKFYLSCFLWMILPKYHFQLFAGLNISDDVLKLHHGDESNTQMILYCCTTTVLLLYYSTHKSLVSIYVHVS